MKTKGKREGRRLKPGHRGEREGERNVEVVQSENQ